MKEGRIVEQGQHEDLVMSGGEYSRLYNVQAKAFLVSAKANHSDY